MDGGQPQCPGRCCPGPSQPDIPSLAQQPHLGDKACSREQAGAGQQAGCSPTDAQPGKTGPDPGTGRAPGRRPCRACSQLQRQALHRGLSMLLLLQPAGALVLLPVCALVPAPVPGVQGGAPARIPHRWPRNEACGVASWIRTSSAQHTSCTQGAGAQRRHPCAPPQGESWVLVLSRPCTGWTPAGAAALQQPAGQGGYGRVSMRV